MIWKNNKMFINKIQDFYNIKKVELKINLNKVDYQKELIMLKIKKLQFKEVKKIWNSNFLNMKFIKLIYKNKFNKLLIKIIKIICKELLNKENLKL